ncbi:MAG: hypothetical protein NT145_07980 [Elusimicrobia bacterium]|nr:hypothetical protein [Elusimicrobiota bacterium]
MKRICTILSILIITNSLFGAFNDSGWGVRPQGMGGAFTAVANDSNANIFNPAGIAQPENHELSFTSSKLFTGLEGVDIGQNFLSYIHRVNDNVGNFGFSWASLYSQNLYREDTIAISYGRFLSDLFKVETFDIACGANLKYLKHEYTTDERTANDPVFSGGNSKGAPTMDLGFLTLFPDTGLFFGLALRNLTSPDVGLKTSDIVPMETAFGVAFFRERMPYLTLPTCTLALDFVSRDKNFDYRFGIETWIFNGNLSVRSGINPQEFCFGLGHELLIKDNSRLEIDYAFSLPLEVEQSSGSHRLGITLRFP